MDWSSDDGPSDIGDLQAIVAFQATLLCSVLEVVIPTVFVLKRTIVIVEIGVFAAEAPSYFPQGQLRREERDKNTRRREKNGMLFALDKWGSPNPTPGRFQVIS